MKGVQELAKELIVSAVSRCMAIWIDWANLLCDL